MPETLMCPHCHRPVTVPDALLGGNISCPYCRGVFATAIPLPNEPPPAPPAASTPFDFSGEPAAESSGSETPWKRDGRAKDSKGLSRAYRHPRCGGVTVVSGDDYVRIECPFRPLTGTFCVGCGKVAPLSDFRWDDTDENIEKYRNRLYYSVPFLTRLYYLTLGNAYEGAIKLKLDKYGKPLRNRTFRDEDED